jgi:hypothetical protein
MNTKVLLAALAAGVFYFFGGWVIYGMLLMDFMTANTTFYEGLMKSEEEMNFAALIVGNLIWGLLIALIVHRTGGKSAKDGAMTGLWFGFLLNLSFYAMYAAMMNLYSTTYMAVDMVVGTLFTAAGGAIAGWLIGRGETAS